MEKKIDFLFFLSFFGSEKMLQKFLVASISFSSSHHFASFEMHTDHAFWVVEISKTCLQIVMSENKKEIDFQFSFFIWVKCASEQPPIIKEMFRGRDMSNINFCCSLLLYIYGKITQIDVSWMIVPSS